MKILFIDILTDNAETYEIIRSTVYEGRSYAQCMEEMIAPHELVTIYAPLAETLPDLRGISGVIIGGSTEDPFRGTEKPWVKKTYEWIRDLEKRRIPLLGICGGLQFVIRALDGDIEYNPNGKTLGTKTYTLTERGMQDPLFQGLGRFVRGQATHKCIASTLQDHWYLLASSPSSPHDAIAIGSSIRLVQFHPEFSFTAFMNLLRLRHEEERAGQVEDVGEIGKKIVRNFIENFCRRETSDGSFSV